jgi:hypothetical protein
MPDARGEACLGARVHAWKHMREDRALTCLGSITEQQMYSHPANSFPQTPRMTFLSIE